MKYIVTSNLFELKRLEIIGKELTREEFEYFFTSDFEYIVRSNVFEGLNEPDEESQLFGHALDIASSMMSAAEAAISSFGHFSYSVDKGFFTLVLDEGEAFISVRRIDV